MSATAIRLTLVGATSYGNPKFASYNVRHSVAQKDKPITLTGEEGVALGRRLADKTFVDKRGNVRHYFEAEELGSDVPETDEVVETEKPARVTSRAKPAARGRTRAKSED